MFKAQQYKWILALRYWEGIVTKVYSHWWELGHAPVVRSYHHKDDWFYFSKMRVKACSVYWGKEVAFLQVF